MIHETVDNFYNQKIYLTNVRISRFAFLEELCREKNVMHIGCADTMVFDVNTNLHIYLSKLREVQREGEPALKKRVEKAIIERNRARAKAVATKIEYGNEELHIAETEAAAAVIALTNFERIKNTQIDGLDIDVETTSKLKEACPGTYYTSYKDVVKTYDIVIVPEVMEHVTNVDLFLQDIFSINSSEYLFTVPSMMTAQIFSSDEYSLETVHPDHKYWFSPYTLYNTLKPFSNGFNIQMYYLENKTQIAMRLFKE